MSEKTLERATDRVLIVDDDEVTAQMLAISLAHDGYACEVAPSGAAAMDAVARQRFQVVISDVRMEGMNGLDLLDRLTKAHPTLPVIIVTGFSKLAGAVDATKRGAFQYLAKPYEVRTLEDIIAQAIRERRSGRDLATGKERPLHRVELVRDPPGVGASPKLLGSERAMTTLQESIDRVAASSAPALIVGESGSGKDLVAHAIHARGPRHDRAFVAVNASAIPEQLLESEIFGHVRGAFTGASDSRRGLFLTAQGGTLFLDEIGDMPLGLQAKLLRVLELGELRAIGSDSVRTIDVRVLAATHRDLPKLIEAGRFREDLYYRLNVLPVVVPPLRERPGDIAELALHFLAQARSRMPTSPVRSISPGAMDALTNAPWPGNVRELASTMERLVVFGREEAITVEQLSSIATHDAKTESPDAPQLRTLRQVNERHVAWVLAQTAGNKMRAAEILGINLSTLYRWQRPRTLP